MNYFAKIMLLCKM